MPVEDVFFYENIFSLYIKTPWLSYIANYLDAKNILTNLSPKEK
jgi:hypothetical protein